MAPDNSRPVVQTRDLRKEYGATDSVTPTVGMLAGLVMVFLLGAVHTTRWEEFE